MRFAVPAADARYEALVVALDQERVPIAATWRAVGEAAPKLGLPRPGYHLVRRLVHRCRRTREAKGSTARALLGVLAALPSPYVVDVRWALGELVDARQERLVLKQHKPP